MRRPRLLSITMTPGGGTSHRIGGLVIGLYLPCTFPVPSLNLPGGLVIGRTAAAVSAAWRSAAADAACISPVSPPYLTPS